MKRFLLLLMVAVMAVANGAWHIGAVAVASSPQPAAAPAKQVVKYDVKGSGAFADFYSVEGCLATYATLWVNEAVSKEGPGKPAAAATAFIQVYSFDSCEGGGPPTFGIGLVDLPANAFRMQGNLVAGTLSTSVDLCCDLSNGELQTATINLSWAGTGPVEKAKKNRTFNANGCKLSMTTTQGNARAAVATGSIVMGGMEYIGQPAQFSDLSSIKEGSLEVGCE